MQRQRHRHWINWSTNPNQIPFNSLEDIICHQTGIQFVFSPADGSQQGSGTKQSSETQSITFYNLELANVVVNGKHRVFNLTPATRRCLQPEKQARWWWAHRAGCFQLFSSRFCSYLQQKYGKMSERVCEKLSCVYCLFPLIPRLLITGNCAEWPHMIHNKLRTRMPFREEYPPPGTEEELLKMPWLVVCREKAWRHPDTQLREIHSCTGLAPSTKEC